MSATQLRQVYKSSDLSRAPGDVFDAASDHPVELTRRDGDSLVLMSKQEDRARTSLLELAAHLVAVATSVKGTLTERMADHYPWMLALSEADREEAAREILESARASFSTNQPFLAVSTLHAWQETAIAVAAGLGKSSIDWLDVEDIDVVERP